MKWIALSNEQPPEGIKVIFLSNHLYEYPDNVYTGVRHGDKMYFANRLMFSMDNYTEPMKKVTHWMLLPEPPLHGISRKETENNKV